MGEILRAIYELQLDDEVTTPGEARDEATPACREGLKEDLHQRA